MSTPSLRAEIVTRRTYNRPLNEEGTIFETWEQTVARVIRHQRWLWERAKRKDLTQQEENELAQLQSILLKREGSVAGRTLWLGGTEISRTREGSNFNCCGLLIKTVFDIVDLTWQLLQGAGVGFMPVVGVLNGFCKPIDSIEIIRSTRTIKGGAENNTETWLHESKTWIIQVGDSAKAWAKAIGKLIAGKYPANHLIIDLSQIRPAGARLRGYGWISSGDEQLSRALEGITKIMNHSAGKLLTAIDILDIANWIGSILSSRRSAELAMLSANHPQWREFATAKQNHFSDNPQRAQSNNSLVFYTKPSKERLREVFQLMVNSGGSEPGIINGQEAVRRAPDFAVLNPCVTGETQILTSDGYRPIQDTIGEEIKVWNGENWSFVTPFSTGVNPILRVELSDGSSLNCTPNHKWLILDGTSTHVGVERRVEAKDLRVGDRLTKYAMPVVTGGEDYRTDAYSQGLPRQNACRFVTVVAVIPCEEEETFCFTEPLAHRGTFNGIVTGQCGEAILGDKSLCNLTEINLAKFNGRFEQLCETARYIARANYRQTTVNLCDGVLQKTWHELNQYLHLCGVGLTGYVQWEYQDNPEKMKELYLFVREGTDGMAEELDLPYSKRVSVIKPSGCRPWYALVTTDQGILSMDELFTDHLEGDWAYFQKDVKVIQKEGSQRITKTYDNGVAPVIKINMVYGMSVESTTEHLWKVIGRQVPKDKYKKMVVSEDRWVRADGLCVDDILDVELGVYRSENIVPMERSRTRSIRSDAYELNPPTHMNTDLAWWLGYLWGNGAQSESGKRTRFMSAYKAHIDRVAELSQSLFGVSGSVLPVSGGRCAWICDISSTKLWYWLDANGFFKYGYFDGLAHIPAKVRQASTEVIIAFIAGLFDADGCASQHKNDDFVSISYTTADAAFAQHFQDVAWAVGLGFSRSHNTGGKNCQKYKSMWLLSLGASVLPESFEIFRKHSLKMTALPEDSRFNMKTQKAITGKITSIEYLEPTRTYDVEVENTHWYYSGSVKSHNSLSKIMDCTEGVHKPLGKYIFNNINFSKHDPLVKTLQASNYHTFENPYDPTGTIVRLPVCWDNVDFEEVDGRFVNRETAIVQLERYRMLMGNYVDQNVSITVSYDPTEIPAIIDWLDTHWDSYVATAFLLRNDPTKTAADLGYPYLPQEVVTQETYDAYVQTLLPVNLNHTESLLEIESQECSGGFCPVR